MINQFQMPNWLTNQQNISINKGELVDALILNAIFRANASHPLGDVEEKDMVKKIDSIRNHITVDQNCVKEEINELVMEEFYG